MLFESKKNKLTTYFCVCVVAFCATQFATRGWYENLADLKFFVGIPLPFDLWIKAFPVPEGYQVAACSEMDEILRVGSRVPVLFKGCISNEHLEPDQYIYLPESRTNVFPPCKARVERHWSFEALDGEVQKYHEWYPCADARPLSAKFDDWLSRDLETQGPSSDLHVHMFGTEEKRRVLRDFAKKGIAHIDPTYFDYRPAAISNFFHVGRTAVDYFHSHMDNGLMMNFLHTKVWTFIAPEYHDFYDYEWSGNANVLLKEHKVAPQVVVEQEAGDVLYVPAWWLHKVGLREDLTKTGEATKGDQKNFGLSLHWLQPGQIVGFGPRIAYELGITNFFYRDSFENHPNAL